MISIAVSFSGKPRQASMAAYRQLLAENHVEEILQDVKQNKNLDRKKELPVWLPLAAGFNNGTRKAEDAVPSGLFFLDIDEKGLTEQLWQKVQDENLIETFRKDSLLKRTSRSWRVAWVSATTRMSPTWPVAVSW